MLHGIFRGLTAFILFFFFFLFLDRAIDVFFPITHHFSILMSCFYFQLDNTFVKADGTTCKCEQGHQCNAVVGRRPPPGPPRGRR